MSALSLLALRRFDLQLHLLRYLRAQETGKPENDSVRKVVLVQGATVLDCLFPAGGHYFRPQWKAVTS
jgi:hypothetical protein